MLCATEREPSACGGHALVGADAVEGDERPRVVALRHEHPSEPLERPRFAVDVEHRPVQIEAALVGGDGRWKVPLQIPDVADAQRDERDPRHVVGLLVQGERFLITLERLAVLGVRVADGRHASECGGNPGIVLALALQHQTLLVGGKRFGKTALKIEGVGDVLQCLAFLLLEPAAPRHLDDQFVDAPRLVVVLAHRGRAGGPPERADHLLAGEGRLRREQRFARGIVWRLEQRGRQIVCRRAFAEQLPVAARLLVSQRDAHRIGRHERCAVRLPGRRSLASRR